MPTRKKSPESAETVFEEDLERLERIVADMEAGELPLDDLMKRFEEGMTLVRRCTTRLADVERKIETLLAQPDDDAAPATAPFPATDAEA
jgi:exodeoxyribonuclease VII small subunit